MAWRYAIHANGKVRRGEPYGFGARLSLAAARDARALIAACPAYRVTPLRRLDEVARAVGVAEVWYKDEASRFGLGSFKALGGAYAVALALAERLSRDGPPVDAADLAAGGGRAAASLTVACASDGNHGRAVAAGARRFGARCVVFLHEGVSPGRADAIRDLGATVVRTPGAYDQSVHHAAETCAQRGWILVSDTAETDTDPRPLRVMQGYTVLAAEVLDELAALSEKPPTHVMLQGGVGGLAAAMVAHFWEALGGAHKPTFIVVEPERADCLLQSARAGEPRPASTTDLETVMAGLSCGEVSRVAWPLLEAGVEYFMTVADAAAVAAMRLLADVSNGEIVAGESGAAGLAGLLALRPAGARGPVPGDLRPTSRVLLIGTEGATDPAIYRQLTGGAA